jgi:hypothetical protein
MYIHNMIFVVLLFSSLVLWKVQPTPMIWAGVIGGLLWAMVESMSVYRTIIDMKKLTSPSKVYTSIQGVVLRSLGTFTSRAMLFYAVNQAMSVSQVPLWAHLFGLSFGFYAMLAVLVSYHRNRIFVK